MSSKDALRDKLIKDLLYARVWEQGIDRIVTPWHWLTVEERDLIADALRKWSET
jgi:hypothetical protein